VIRWPLVRQRRWLASTLYIMSSTLINRLVRLPPTTFFVPLARSETDTAQKSGALLELFCWELLQLDFKFTQFGTITRR
jgi:hypothetical protein